MCNRIIDDMIFYYILVIQDQQNSEIIRWVNARKS